MKDLIGDLSIENLTFVFPQALYAFALFPLLIGLYWWTQRQRPAVIRFSSLFYFQNKSHSSILTLALRHLPFALRMLALSLLIVIFAQPARPGGEIALEKTGIDIMIALDISSSMKEAELTPNRLSVAKTKAEEFIVKRSNDRIGLVLFGSEAFLQCPLTLDHQLLLSFVRETDFIEEISSQTTLGKAIAMSIIALKRGKPTTIASDTSPATNLHNNSNQNNSNHTSQLATTTSPHISPAEKSPADLPPSNNQVIILITDGQNTSAEVDPLTAAQIASIYGIKIYTIGIGQEEGHYTLTPGGSATHTSTSQTFIDASMLKQVSEITEGRYYNVRDNQTLEQTFATIDRLEKTAFVDRTLAKRDDRYMSFAMLFFITFALEKLTALLIIRKRPA